MSLIFSNNCCSHVSTTTKFFLQTSPLWPEKTGTCCHLCMFRRCLSRLSLLSKNNINWLKQIEVYFSWSWSLGKSKIKVSAIWFLTRVSILIHRQLSSLCVFIWCSCGEGRERLWWVGSKREGSRGINPILMSLSLMTSSKPNYLPKTPSQNTVTWRD